MREPEGGRRRLSLALLYINLANGLNGSWADNAGNFNQVAQFNPANTCQGGPRTGPISGDRGPGGE